MHMHMHMCMCLGVRDPASRYCVASRVARETQSSYLILSDPGMQLSFEGRRPRSVLLVVGVWG